MRYLKIFEEYSDYKIEVKNNNKGAWVFFLKKDNQILLKCLCSEKNNEITLNYLNEGDDLLREELIKYMINYFNKKVLKVRSSLSNIPFFEKLGFKRKDFNSNFDELEEYGYCWMYLK